MCVCVCRLRRHRCRFLGTCASRPYDLYIYLQFARMNPITGNVAAKQNNNTHARDAYPRCMYVHEARSTESSMPQRLNVYSHWHLRVPPTNQSPACRVCALESLISISAARKKIFVLCVDILWAREPTTCEANQIADTKHFRSTRHSHVKEGSRWKRKLRTQKKKLRFACVRCSAHISIDEVRNN